MLGPERASLLANRYAEIREKTKRMVDGDPASARPERIVEVLDHASGGGDAGARQVNDLEVPSALVISEADETKPASWWARFVFSGAPSSKADALIDAALKLARERRFASLTILSRALFEPDGS